MFRPPRTTLTKITMLTSLFALVFAWVGWWTFQRADPSLPHAQKSTDPFEAAASGDPALRGVLQEFNDKLARQEVELNQLRQQLRELGASDPARAFQASNH